MNEEDWNNSCKNLVWKAMCFAIDCAAPAIASIQFAKKAAKEIIIWIIKSDENFLS